MTTTPTTAPITTLKVRKQGKEYLLLSSTYTVATFPTRESADLVLVLAIYRASLMSPGEYNEVGPFRLARRAAEVFTSTLAGHHAADLFAAVEKHEQERNASILA